MKEETQVDWNPRDASVLGDQRAAYDEMREGCPVAHSEFLGWSIFRNDDIRAILDDPTTYSNASRRRPIPNGIDPPEHALYRTALESFFTPERMTAFEPECRTIAVDLVESLRIQGTIDFVPEFAETYPLKALCAFMGWPQTTWVALGGWVHGNQEASFSLDRDRAKELARDFWNYVANALREERGNNRAADASITAELMLTEVNDAPLSDDDIANLLRNWTAGQGTVGASLSILAHALASQPELQAGLRSDPSLIPAAIEEILRSDGPLVANRRTTTRDVEIGGQRIGTGEKLSLMWIAANRDPQSFDDPASVHLDRVQDKNLVFGAGIHDCVGAPLARMEMRIALEELLARTSRIEGAGNDGPGRYVYPSNGFESLHLRLT